MRAISLINRHALLLVALALLVNTVFLCLHNKKVYFAITQAHGQIGYHVYNNNVLGMDPTLTAQMNDQMHRSGSLVDYDTLEGQQFNPTAPFPINDTVAYGLLLGLIWKITDSLQFRDVQIVQIIIFSLLMLFYYQVAYLLFGSAQIAFCCGIMQLLFFPLIAYNVMPVRDVWAYYGLLMLCYGALAYYYQQINRYSFIACISFFALCLWMRPTLAFAAIMMTLFFIIDACNIKHCRQRSIALVVTLWAVTGLLFWLPFIYVNKKQYDRCFVSPAGQSLLEGLGELPNRWGHKLNDEYVNEFIGNKYNMAYGTVAFDEAAMHEFKQCVQEDPAHYIKTLIYRLPDVLLPGLQWIFYEQSPYAHCNGAIEKLMFVFSSPKTIIDFMFRHMFMRIYLLCAYIGMFLLVRQKRYMAVPYEAPSERSMGVGFIIICLLSGLSTYPSHIEYRYIVPFYWVASLVVGFLFSVTMKRIFNSYYKKRLFL